MFARNGDVLSEAVCVSTSGSISDVVPVSARNGVSPAGSSSQAVPVLARNGDVLSEAVCVLPLALVHRLFLCSHGMVMSFQKLLVFLPLVSFPPPPPFLAGQSS